jgi:hypothetical protein
LWKRVSEVQQKGGSMAISNLLSTIEKKSDDVLSKLIEFEKILRVMIK